MKDHKGSREQCEKTPKVLLVEDDSLLRQVMGHTLGEHGFHCEEAMNGRIGLQKMCEATALRDPFDCVVLDIAMPDVNGWQFLRALKSNPLWAGTKVLILTGYAVRPEDVARASAYDCVHVQKR